MITPDTFYTDTQKTLQKEHDTDRLAELVVHAIVRDEIEEPHIPFIASRDFFFLSTVSPDGEPTVSYKGGAVGFVKIIDSKTLVFPNYHGNGMFKSMGNLMDTAKIGLLFIDMETPNRVRVQGRATASTDDAEMANYPGANMIIRVAVTSCFVNCAQYIHKHKRVENSPYIPDQNGQQPYPSWKRMDLVQEALPARDKGKTEAAGGPISREDYVEKLMSGNS